MIKEVFDMVQEENSVIEEKIQEIHKFGNYEEEGTLES